MNITVTWHTKHEMHATDLAQKVCVLTEKGLYRYAGYPVSSFMRFEERNSRSQLHFVVAVSDGGFRFPLVHECVWKEED